MQVFEVWKATAPLGARQKASGLRPAQPARSRAAGFDVLFHVEGQGLGYPK